MPGDPLWYYQNRAGFNEFAAKVARACAEHLIFERQNFHRLPEPEVEEVTRAIANDAADPWDPMQMLREIRSRHMVAEHCHLFERRRVESRPIPGEPDKTIDVEVAPEHPVNTWLRSLSDSVIMGLIRENPYWLRNAAVADRICARRSALLKGNADARKLLRQLTTSSVVGAARGRPSGPRAAAPARQWAMSRYEKEARGKRAAWLGLRTDNPGVGLIELGRRMLCRLDGWDSPEVEEWSARRRFDPYRELTEPQLLMHLGQLLLVVKDRDDKDYVVIDEEAWPRAEALALLSARWQVSKRWIREGLGQPGQ